MAHATSYTSVEVAWKAIPEDVANGLLIAYVVKLEGTADNEIYGCASKLEMTIGGLEKSKVYKIRVAGFTSKGRGNFSEYVVVVTSIDGCSALGMEAGNITKSQLSASSEATPHHIVDYARLNHPKSWATNSNDMSQWLQVMFLQERTVTKVATQGRSLEQGEYYQWVTSYTLKYSHDGISFEFYKPLGGVKVFQANWNRRTTVYNTIIPPIKARYIRILPRSWVNHITMRAEFYHCEYDLKVDPVNVTSSSTNATSVSLSWQPLDPLKFGGSVSNYRVEIVDLLRGERFNYTINSSTNAELDFLKPFTPYEFKVFGSTGSWEGNITDIISLKTQEDAPSEPPRNLSVQHSAPSETTLQWEPVHEYAINGKLRGYKIKYKETASSTSICQTIVMTVNETQQSRKKRNVADNAVRFSLKGLKPYTAYTVLVLAFTIKDGVPTLATNFTTAQDVPDLPPINVAAYNTSSTSVNVTWLPIPPDHVNGIILAYHLIYWRVDKVNDNITAITTNSTALNIELAGLGKYKLYSIQVAGRTVAGLGNFSNSVYVRTAEDVPDDPPSHIRATGTEPTVIRAHWLPVSKETINGICLGYKLDVFNITGQKIGIFTVNSSVLSLEVTGLEVWTNYSIKMAAFTVIGDGPWSSFVVEDTDEEAPNKAPRNLDGKATNSTSIFVNWESVVLPNIRGILRGYLVYYKEAPGSVHPSVLKNTTVDISVTDAYLVNLHKFTEYQIWVTAFTTRQGLLSNTALIKTLEDIPEHPPLYITYSSPSSTTLLLRWGPVPPQFKNGIIRGFKVEYQENKPNATVEVQERGLANWALLSELKRFTEYSVRVRAFTSVGYGPENSITVITSQDVPSKAPNNIIAESHVTLTTIPVTWQPIHPHHIHGVLLGYKIRYQAIAVGQEPAENQPIMEQRVDASTLSIVLENLEIFTLYRVDVLGYTIMGDGPPATANAETCRCYKRLTTTWFEYRPYVKLSEDNTPSGIIPPILKKLVVACCESCQSHGTSYLDLNSNGLNQSAKLPNLHTFKSSIANPTDFFFPVYGHKDQTHFAKEFGYHGLVESPGMAYVINTNSHDDLPNAVLMNIWSCWPAIAIFMAITYLAGLAVWALESKYNPNDFPSSFLEGGSEGFYWAFVSTTTVGYGDRAPITVLGRLFALFVILSGLVIFGLVNSVMATAITSVAMETDYKIYGAKVAAISGSPEYRMAVRKNAWIDKDQEYHTLEELYKALKERKVIGALIDTYNGGSNKDMFDTEHLRVNKILDYSSTYGVVMGKEARKLRMCFKDYIQHAFANEISQHIQKNTEQSKEPPDPLPVERSTGLFDSQSTVFQRTLLITTTLLISSLMLGTIYEVGRLFRARSKVQPQDLRKAFAVEMKKMVEEFNQNMNRIKVTMALRHENERKHFLKMYRKHPKRKYEDCGSIGATSEEELNVTKQPKEQEADC